MRRLKLFEASGGLCYLCGCKIQPAQKWDVEHPIPLALGGADDESNMAPAHKACHAPKTAIDVARIAKAKRMKIKHMGGSSSRNPLPCGRSSKWRKKISGEVVLR
jgi:5-methylcytosine-specific restriction enzyme A